jgi:hypothetical protein
LKCPECGNNRTIKWGSQNGRKRYFCKKCNKSFSINHRRKKPVFWIPHIDGISFRNLADEYSTSPAKAMKQVEKEMNNLPTNTRLTYDHCNRFCGILVVDGKFVKVKGYKQKIPYIYCIDYLTHDIPVGILVPSESEEAFKKLFRLLKTCNYPLQVVICDDVISSLKPALLLYYPKAKIQLCLVHYLENIRKKLNIRTTANHQHFFNSLCKHIFRECNDDKKLDKVLHHILTKRAKKDMLRQQITMEIHQRRTELFTYKTMPHCPKDTNLIELFNSHLNARLDSVKGFQSLHSAKRWLNAYTLRRRSKPFIDCEGKFKHLNGKCSLEMTVKKRTKLSDIISKYQLEMKR